MTEVINISHTCPICGAEGLQILLERNLKFGLHEEVCANDDYAHVRVAGRDFFVRKATNILREISDSVFHVELV